MAEYFSGLKDDFIQSFVAGNRWLLYLKGIGVTLQVAAIALVLGIILGVLVAVVRTSHDQQRPGKHNPVLGVLNVICQIYTTVIRGTPIMVQLLIMYFVIFASTRNQIGVAMLTFGVNSGAYVSEIIRGGIMSIDKGQMEAGRSLGLSKAQTMVSIIIPQAFRAVLPTYTNEFVVLVKETSVAGYVAVQDLTKGGDIIRSRTYSPFLPLIAVALIYLVLVMFFSWLVSKLERRLRNSDH